MTLESYRNFVTIVECGSILAAANQLLIAQPSLSNQLKNIEAYYGAKLLIRNRHKLELTDAGRVFYLHAREICQAEEKLHNDIHNKKTAFSELLKLSIPAGNSAYFLHHLFDDFRAAYPNVNFDFYEIPSDISQLADYPLAVPFDCLDLVRSSFGHLLLAPNISIITSSNATAIEWARSFGTIALASLTTADFQHIKDLAVKHFSDDNLFITSAFIVNKEYPLSRAARNFLGFHGVEI